MPRAKKETAAAPPVSAPAAASAYDGLVSKAECLREIRKHLLKELGREPRGSDVYEVFKDTKFASGQEEKDKAYINTTLSAIRKRIATDAGLIPIPGKRGKYMMANTSPSPNVSELRHVREAAKHLSEGLDELDAYLSVSLALLDKFDGNPQKLREAVAFLKEVTAQ
jgi:hypothetical protein